MDPLVEKLLLVGAGIAPTSLIAWAARRQGAREKAADVLAVAAAGRETRITELESKLALINQVVEPLAKAMQTALIKDLTHFHTPRLDFLMTKIGPPPTLTLAESTEMYALLKERMVILNGTILASERDAAEMLPGMIRRALAESLEIKDIHTPDAVLKMVSVPGATHES